MDRIEKFISEVESTRKDFIAVAAGLSQTQAEFKPNPDVWSIRDIVEHIVWAERAGVVGMWKAVEGVKSGTPVWEGENVNKGLSIEEVVDNTWQEKEKSPEIAEPMWG